LAREARAKVEAEFDVRQNAGKLVRQFEAHARVPA
jgi:hypothetical protein